MKRVLALVLLALGFAACEHPVTVQEEAALQQHLQEWSQGMYDWGMRIADVVCDLKVKNTPDAGAYTTETNDFCGPGDPDPRDPPPPPPDWLE